MFIRIFVASLTAVLIAGIVWLFVWTPEKGRPRRPRMEPITYNVRRQPPPEMAQECRERLASRVRMLRRDTLLWEKSIDEFLAQPGAVTITNGGRKQRALPVAVLLPEEGVEGLTLVPCSGEPVQLLASELRADPDRFLLVANQRKALKLIIRDEGIKARPVIKHLWGIKIVPLP